MPLPSSGPISFNAINVELAVSGTTQASLGQTSYRTLAGVPSGAISMSNFYGKANQFSLTISSDQTNANLRTLAVNAGWDQSVKVVATINSGIYVSSNSTGTPALTISGAFPNGLNLINNGVIAGMGGAGGIGAGANVTSGVPGTAGSGGGGALSVSTAVSITNNGTIGGGGGGGGGAKSAYYNSKYGNGGFSGGGGGGGQTGRTNSAGGGTGPSNPPGLVSPGYPGNPGTVSGGGAGGIGGGWQTANGGPGGGYGSSGATGGASIPPWAVQLVGPYVGGSGGYAVSGNANITWVATGTRLGSIG